MGYSVGLYRHFWSLIALRDIFIVGKRPAWTFFIVSLVVLPRRREMTLNWVNNDRNLVEIVISIECTGEPQEGVTAT